MHRVHNGCKSNAQIICPIFALAVLLTTACSDQDDRLTRRPEVPKLGGTMLPSPRPPMPPGIRESLTFHEHFEELAGPFATPSEVTSACLDCHDAVEAQFEESGVRDCLPCHARGSYDTTAAGLAGAAGSVGLPETTSCMRCHDNIDLSSDVHRSRHGFRCQSCHVSRQHRMAGSEAHGNGGGGSVSCQGCHESPIHKLPILDLHARSMHCGPCHLGADERGHTNVHGVSRSVHARRCGACHERYE